MIGSSVGAGFVILVALETFLLSTSSLKAAIGSFLGTLSTSRVKLCCKRRYLLFTICCDIQDNLLLLTLTFMGQGHVNVKFRKVITLCAKEEMFVHD